MIRIKNLTKDYGNGKGIYDVSFEVLDGETFGFLGPNGSGKTTTMRQLMGFAAPSGGRCYINGKNCYSQAEAVMEYTGYVPGEMTLPDYMTGLSFLRFLSSMRHIKSIERALELSERFELDLDRKIKRMSAGEKQKLAIISAFMHRPSILLLDEPSNCLDPLMQNRFIELIQEEKKRGTTILLSSHKFEEIERTCDRVGMMKNGMLIAVNDVTQVMKQKKNLYRISFYTREEAMRFVRCENFEVCQAEGVQLNVELTGELLPLIKALGNYEVIGFENIAQNLEDIFMHYYGGDYHV